LLAWLPSRKQTTTNADKDAGSGRRREKEHLYTVGGNVHLHSHYRSQHGGSSKKTKTGMTI
jgi:hypothetical protein